MKKVIGVLIFLCSIFIIDWIGSIILEKLLLKSKFRYVRMYEGKSPSDTVIVGNSRGVNSFFAPLIEKKIGKQIANISYNGLKIELATALLKDYVEIYNPKLVIVEGSMLFNRPKDVGLLKDFKLYQGYSKRLSELIDRDANNEFIATKLFKLYKFNTSFFYRNLVYLNKSDKTWINNYKLSSALVEKTQKMEPFSLEIWEESLTQLKKELNLLKQKGITVKIIFGPYLPDYKIKVENYNSLMTRLKNELGVEIFDYSDALTEQKYFGDRVHSNKAGAIILGEQMVNNGVFNYD